MADEELYDATPEGSAKRWAAEFKAARDRLSAWHTSAEKCDQEYLAEAPSSDGDESLNLYASGTDLKEATLYGNTPAVDVERRDGDQDDDDARVAAEILKRVLNGDLERDGEQFPNAIGLALKDWLVPGLGNIWIRFEREMGQTAEKPAMLAEDGTEQAPAVPAAPQLVSEDAPTDYVFWKDQLWSPARVFPDVRWWSRFALLSKKTIAKKFGEENVPLSIGADPKDITVPKTPWARAMVWEIWDKENKCVWFYIEGHPRVLVPRGDDGQPLPSNPDGSIPDPLKLPGFWPFPEPLIEGASNSKLVPRPSYSRAQHLYASINNTTTRIGLLRDAVDASGIYDKTVGELATLFDTRGRNMMIPAENYKALAEKGGIAACVSWKPLEAIIAAMDTLREMRKEDIDLVFQVDGTSDIMRGQATQSGATATEQAIKAKYGSIRGDKAQKRFARFCSEAQRIRAAIVCQHFSPETIATRANVRGLPVQDQQRVPAAIQLLKSDFARFRITVKAESVSLTDYAANRQEALEVIGMIGQYFAAIMPIVQGSPQLGPKLLDLLTVFVSRVKGGDAAESVLDEVVKQATLMAQQAEMAQRQAAQQGPPQDPKAQTEQIKLQAVGAKANAEEFKARAGMAQTAMEMKQSEAEHMQNMQALEAEVRSQAMKQALGPEAGNA